jgi:predicted transposase/invertase (TIGR01784 family)
MDLTILPVKSDVIFRIFFTDERNIEFLTDFLKSALSIPAEEYDEVVIVDPHLIREYPKDKLGIIDVKLKTVSGKTVHIEIQVLSNFSDKTWCSEKAARNVSSR